MTAADNRDKKSRRKTIWFSVLAALVVVGQWWRLASILPGCFANSWDKRGQRGDAFGMVNSLFVGLAFVGLIVAIALQSQELRLQRGELELTREEMDR